MATTCCCSSSSSSQQDYQIIMDKISAVEDMRHIDDLISYIAQLLNKEPNIAKTAHVATSINSAGILVNKVLKRSRRHLCKRESKRKVNRETRKLMIDVANQAARIKWLGIVFSVVAFVLERVEQDSSNTEECLKLLKYMCDLSKYIKQLNESLPQEKLNRVLQFIVEGSALCIAQIESDCFSRCLGAPVMAEDLQNLRKDLEHQYSDLSLEAITVAIIPALGRIEEAIIPLGDRIPEVLPPSQGLPTQAVGTEEPSEDVTQLLHMGNESIIAVVIYGQGGIGKTTLATTVFNKLDLRNYKFCRVDMQQDCRETDIKELQQQILKDLFDHNIQLRSWKEGLEQLSKEFKKATTPLFIFIDNALRESDLEKLLPLTELASLPAQSRILLTTRNLNETRQIRLAGIERPSYSVPTLPREEAHKLLCKFALGNAHASFERSIDIEGLLQICGGVPLVLTLAGARLREHIESVSDCREEVEYLKSWLVAGEEGDLSERMVDFVYNRLGGSCKEAFLDICFYFYNWKRLKVACAVGETELRELEGAALVNITYDRTVDIHDIVQARGKRLSPHGERITEEQSLTDVLQTEEMIRKTKGLSFEGDSLQPRHLNLMSRCLRVLIMRDVECKGALENLRFLSLETQNYSLIDVSKHPRLAVLVLRAYGGCELASLASPSALKYIYLRGATFANMSTTFSQLRTLRVLKLRWCEGFDGLPESIGVLTALEKVDFIRYSSLASLPDNFGKLCSLTYLRLRACQQLSALPESFGNLASLEVLRLEGCRMVLNLPQNFGQLKRLKYLSICGCSQLQSLSADFEGLSSLIAINASHCPKLQGETIERLAKMKGVMMVQINGSPQLEERWKQVEDQYSLAVEKVGFNLDCEEYMGRAVFQAVGSRFVQCDENGMYGEWCPSDIWRDGVELCVLLTVCDMRSGRNRRYMEEMVKKWEEAGGQKMKVFVDVGVSWEESERRAREMLPLLPKGSRAWIAPDSRARLLFAYSLFLNANNNNYMGIKYHSTVIAAIPVRVDTWGQRRMPVEDFIIPDCTPDFEDAHIFHQLFSPISKAQEFFRPKSLRHKL